MYVKSGKRCKTLDEFKKYLLGRQTSGYVFLYHNKEEEYIKAVDEAKMIVENSVEEYKDLLLPKWVK